MGQESAEPTAVKAEVPPRAARCFPLEGNTAKYAPKTPLAFGGVLSRRRRRRAGGLPLLSRSVLCLKAALREKTVGFIAVGFFAGGRCRENCRFYQGWFFFLQAEVNRDYLPKKFIECCCGRFFAFGMKNRAIITRPGGFLQQIFRCRFLALSCADPCLIQKSY